MWRAFASAAGPAALVTLAACTGDEFKASGTGGSASTSAGGDATGASGGKAGGGNEGGTGECKGGLGCAPELPDGWSGIVALYVGSEGDLECDGPAAVRGGTGNLTVPPHSCSSCQCSLPVGVTCTPPTVSIHSGLGCIGTPLGTVVVDTNCPQTLGTVSLRASVTSIPTGGSCEPSGGQIVQTEPTFQTFAVVCDPAEGSIGDACGSGSCLSVPGAPFEPAFCVYQEGSVGCPTSFPARTVVYGEIDDDRECTACNCAPPTAASCPAPLKGHTNASCGGGVLGSVPNDTNCHDLTAYGSINRDPPALGGSCATTGGVEVGTATPDAPTTVCCTN